MKPIRDIALHCVLLTFIYYVTGTLGLHFAAPPGYATLVWPPAGLAVAALYLFGPRLWPGVLIGSYLVNLWVPTQIGRPTHAFLSILPALGATIQALAGAKILHEIAARVPFRKAGAMRSIVEHVAVYLPAAFLIGAVNGLLGPTFLLLAGALPRETIGATYFNWCIGDALGVLVFTPAMLAISRLYNTRNFA